jgi:hypothetical protein
MGTKNKSIALVLVVLFLASLVSLEVVTVKAQSSNNSISAPAIEWQQVYGSQVNYASNLIQTVDGGYVFMDSGYGVTGWFKPSIIFKVDSNGTLQWNRTIADFFTGSEIIQTNDKGFEISGWWNAYRFGGDYHTIPTIINTDPNGNILQIRNYTNLPSLGTNYSKEIYPFEHKNGGSIQTSDEGFAYWTNGNITKTDSGNKTQWVKTLVYPTWDAYPTYTYPLMITSVIETSDGGLASLSVGYNLLGNDYTGKIYLIKTTPFLPIPSQTQLPTPFSSVPEFPSWTIPLLLSIMLASAGLLVYHKKHNHSLVNKV